MTARVKEEDLPLPEGWIKCSSKSMQGKEYYFNTLNGESLWEHPSLIPVEHKMNEKKNLFPTTQANHAGENILRNTAAVSKGSSIGIGVNELKGKEANINEPVVQSKAKGEKSRITTERKTQIPLAPLPRRRLESDKIIQGNKKVRRIVTTIEDVRKVERKKDGEALPVSRQSDRIENCSVGQKRKNADSRVDSSVNNRFSGGSTTDVSRDDRLASEVSPKNTPPGKIMPPKLSPHSSLHSKHPAKISPKTLVNDNDKPSNTNIGQRKVTGVKKTSEIAEKVRTNQTAKPMLPSLPPLKPLKKSKSLVNSKKNDLHQPSRIVNSSYRIPKTTVSPKNVPQLAEGVQNQSQMIGKVQNRKDTIHISHGIRNCSEGSIMSSERDLDNYRNPELMTSQNSTCSDSDVVMATGSDVNGGGESETAPLGQVSGEQPMLDDMSCEEMEVDDVEFMQRKIFQEIEGMRLERISIPKPTDSDSPQEFMDIPQGILYIIVDTNILLSHLKFIFELKDHPIPGIGRPILVIPWMVVQELDRLKEAPDTRVHEFGEESENEHVSIGVNILARRAVAFLNSCLTENHPRVRGQTLLEARQSAPGLVEETNDDSILSCCLLYQSKAEEGSKTVLLSNDRNLCNKAIVNGVKAFPKKALLSSLRDLFQSGSLIVHQDHFKEYFEEAGIQEALAERRKKADDLKCELQCILREAFSAVIEKEMKEAYDDIWLQIVKIKPPWTLVDTLQLLERHWIAVFGQVIRRNLKEQVLTLKKKFTCGEGTSKSLLESGELIDFGFVLCEAFSKRSDYDGVMPKCLAAVTVLQRRCKESLAAASPALISNTDDDTTLPKRMRLENGPASSEEISNCVTSILHETDSTGVITTPTTPTKAGLHFGVMSSFDEIWRAVTTLSSTIFDSLQYPNPYGVSADNTEQRPSKDEALRFLQLLVPSLDRLVHAIQGVLACPLEANDLGDCIAEFMEKIMCRNYKVNLRELRSFCLDDSCRTALINGLSQLNRASAMLHLCLSCSLR